MYPFALCKKAEKHPGKQGQFMIGVKKVAESEVAVLMDMLGDLPMTHIFQEDGLYLDGVVQGIRAFGDTPQGSLKGSVLSRCGKNKWFVNQTKRVL